MLHVSGTRLVSRLKAVVARGDAPSAAVDLPPQCYSCEGKIELIHVLGYLEELLDCLADQIRAAQACGDIRAGLNATAEAVAIMGAMRGIMGQWLIAPDSVDLDAVRDNFIAGLRRSWMP